jgi:fructuronate reductase
MVHLGVGAFHRSHAAVYVDSILPIDPGWGIIGASLRRPDTRDALQGQDFLYTLAVRSAKGTETRVIGSLLDVLDANTQRNELLRAMADPRIRIVSLTVTEKGYCHDPASGSLDPSHPEIIHDLAQPEAPVSALGLIVRALELRRLAGVAPFTVLCCDNLPSNGRTVSRIVQDFAALRDTGLAAHIQNDVAFPSTMVDRIVPATTDEDREAVAAATGFSDTWPVMTEPFTQWVIEDRFPTGRPPFERAGAEMVQDVAPFERMKLRLLNGSHSTLAYLGYLAGYEYVNQVLDDPDFRALIKRLMTEEVIPTLAMNVEDLTRYRDALLVRFANPALKHRTWQIAMDGSQKLPQRLLGTIRDLLKCGKEPRYASLGVAAWIRYAIGKDEKGAAIDVRDPLAATMRSIADRSGNDAARLVDGFLSLGEVFGPDLRQSKLLRELLTRCVSQLLLEGSAATVRAVLRA